MLNGIKIGQENENRKIWRREWRYQKLGRENDFSIPFEYRTAVWPDIKMFDIEEKDFRFKAVGYEISLTLDVGMNHAVYIRALGINIMWDAFQDRLMILKLIFSSKKVLFSSKLSVRKRNAGFMEAREN